MKPQRALRSGLLALALATSAAPAVALAAPKPPAGKKAPEPAKPPASSKAPEPAKPPASSKAPEPPPPGNKAAPGKDSTDDGSAIVILGLLGGVVLLGGIGFVIYRLTSGGAGGGSGRGSADPEEAVAIFVDASKGEDARRAQIAIIESLSDRLGSSSDEGAKRSAQMAYAKLAGALGDPLPWVRTTALKGLREIAGVFRYDIDKTLLQQPLPAALGLLNGDPDPAIRVAASELLSGLLDQVDDAEKGSVVGSIARLLDDASDDAQAAGCFNLGSCGSAAAAHWGSVAAKLGSSSEKVRGHAASGLWMIGNDAPDPGVVARLVTMLRSDPAAKVRADVANALGKLGQGSPDALAALVAALDDRDKDVRHFAIFAISDHAEAAAAAVPKLASLAGGEHRDAVGIALQAIGTPEAKQALTQAGLPLE